jgi:hypothetical protein
MLSAPAEDVVYSYVASAGGNKGVGRLTELMYEAKSKAAPLL